MRPRTFPIGHILAGTSISQRKGLSGVVRSLDHLLLGDLTSRNKICEPPDTRSTHVAASALKSLRNRLEARQTSNTAIADVNPTDEGGYQEHWFHLQNGWSHDHMQVGISTSVTSGPTRGSFCPIDASRIGLPKTNASTSESWTKYLPPQTKELFTDPENGEYGTMIERMKGIDKREFTQIKFNILGSSNMR